MTSQPGLGWKPSLFGSVPIWAMEPRIDIVEHVARQKLGQPLTCNVEYFGQGAFNKLYVVQCENEEYMMRVSLPVDPRHKTLSEVATLDYVRQHTDIPVPKVVAFDASNDNELGFEWILMEKMPGKPLAENWRTMSWTAKETLVRRLALYAAQLFRKKFDLIGGLYHKQSYSITSKTSFKIDRIVSPQFFWADHVKQDVPRGPFKSSYDWLFARLLFNKNDYEQALLASDDEEDLDDEWNSNRIAEKLLSFLPSTFPPGSECSEFSALMHDDLSNNNILVDRWGNLTAVVDWECVPALPLWKVCQLPALLEGGERRDCPNKNMYAKEKDGEVNELFWEHLLEYEQTQLRVVFMKEMERIEPSWVDMQIVSRRKTEFEKAINSCDNVFCHRAINEWLENFSQEDKTWSLRKRLDTM